MINYLKNILHYMWAKELDPKQVYSDLQDDIYRRHIKPKLDTIFNYQRQATATSTERVLAASKRIKEANDRSVQLGRLIQENQHRISYLEQKLEKTQEQLGAYIGYLNVKVEDLEDQVG